MDKLNVKPSLAHLPGAEGKVRTLYDKISAAANCAKEKQLRAERDKKIAEEVRDCALIKA